MEEFVARWLSGSSHSATSRPQVTLPLFATSERSAWARRPTEWMLRHVVGPEAKRPQPWPLHAAGLGV